MEKNGHKFSPGMLCAGGAKKGSCYVRLDIEDLIDILYFQGDSGGALAVEGVLAGIVSHGGSDDCTMVLISSLISTFPCFLRKVCLISTLMWFCSCHGSIAQ